MTFEEILDQALAMLQRQGRVTYRALQRQFALDDASLADLKDALLFAHPQVADEGGHGLVWTAASGTTRASGPPPEGPPGTPAPRAGQTAVPPAEPPGLEAERRQLTVLFCDLVDSTPLARQLDPEDYREVLRAYQATCAEVIQRFEGYIAQHLGDGLLSYFGYPRAHEDDAWRAVQAGLALLDALAPLKARLAADQGIRLAVRLGIHTGLVVVGAVGTGGRQETLALGDTPNVAARLQGLAAPDTVVVSDATWRLVQGYFAGDDLGPQPLKGMEVPVRAYRVQGASGAQSRLDVVPLRGLTPLVGREAEVALLRARWAQAQDGLGQVVVLSGEAGIGKSRLLRVLHEHIAAEPHVRVEWRCSPYAQQSPLQPVIAHLHRLLRWHPDAAPAEKLHTLEETLTADGFALPEVVPLLAALLSLPLLEHYPPLTLTPQRQRQKTLDTLLAWLFAEAARQPVLFIVEDLHWIDPSTLELLTLLIDQGPVARLLTLLTCRTEFAVPWGFRAHLTPLTLSRLPQPHVAQMVGRVAGGKTLPAEVVAQIVAKTDGVPLFVEELTKTVLESGLLQEREAHYELTGPLPPLAIPATLHDSLMARLDRLTTVKHVAQLGATIGRTFAYELLQAVASLQDATLQQGLRQLVEAELVYQRGVPPQATYTFKHALIQDAAYQSLLRSTRQQVHQRIAQVLEAQFPETAETQPELLAHHFTEASLPAQAIAYWQQAGQRALERSAYVEASSHLTRGLEVLTGLPETPERSRRELVLQNTLGQALIATQGYGTAAVERVYLRARELSQHVGEIAQVFPTLYGVWVFHYIRSELRTAHALGADMLQRAQQHDDSALRLVAHRLMGTTWCFLGEFIEARSHLEQVLTQYDPQQHRGLTRQYSQDVGVAGCVFLSWTLWLLGYPDQALARAHEALTLARQSAHPFSLAFALNLVATVHQFRREAHATHELAETAMALCREQGFVFWLTYAVLTRSLAFATFGQGAEEQPQIHQSLEAASNMRPYWLALLADAYGKGEQTVEGLRMLAEALATVGDTGEYFWEAELYRLKGELWLALPTDNQAAAEACLHQALVVARRQQAKSLELRAAVSLARLWQQQGKRTHAYELLAPVYGWFTEGFETADLQEAKALLEALGI